jgi:hypothetical protein
VATRRSFSTRSFIRLSFPPGRPGGVALNGSR